MDLYEDSFHAGYRHRTMREDPLSEDDLFDGDLTSRINPTLFEPADVK